jgi:hypothetical protein
MNRTHAVDTVTEMTDQFGQRWRLVPLSRSRFGAIDRCRLDMADSDSIRPQWIPALSVDIDPSGAVASVRTLSGFDGPADDLVAWIQNGA